MPNETKNYIVTLVEQTSNLLLSTLIEASNGYEAFEIVRDRMEPIYDKVYEVYVFQADLEKSFGTIGIKDPEYAECMEAKNTVKRLSRKFGDH